MARNNRQENVCLKEINDDIVKNMRLLTVYTDPQRNMTLTRELEDLNMEGNDILGKQGEKLAHRAKTKWYNEGERSNKYFLNLLAKQNELSENEVFNGEW
jgi:hypothetical protein